MNRTAKNCRMNARWIVSLVFLLAHCFAQECNPEDRITGGENIALGKPTRQSSTYSEAGILRGSNLAVDGDISTDYFKNSCCHTDPYGVLPAWWSVNLKEERILKRIVIFNRMDRPARLKGASIIGYAANGSRYVLEHSLGNMVQYEIIVMEKHLIQNVTIVLPYIALQENIINICEVQVFADLNIAMGKRTEQSTTYLSYNSYLAVDGNKANNFADESCTATAPWTSDPTSENKAAWWSVDLGAPYLISVIKIFNREDGGDVSEFFLRLGHFNVTGIGENDEQVVLYREDKDNPGQIISIALFNTISVPVKSIRVSIPSPYRPIAVLKENVLTICEFEAYKVIECGVYTLHNGAIYVLRQGDNMKNYTYCATLNLTCAPGYKLFPNDSKSTTTMCQKNGSWTTMTYCTDIDECRTMSTSACSNQGNCINTPGSFTCVCNPGFTGAKCESPIFCTIPVWKPDKIIYSSNFCSDGNCPYNSVLTISCQDGYYLIGEESSQCDGTGQWTGQMGHCEVVHCNISLIQPAHGKVIYTEGIAGIGTYNTVATVICNEGYNITGETAVRCSKSGAWEGSQGHCSAIVCTLPVGEPDKIIYSSNRCVGGKCPYNSILTISCQDGYHLIGEVSSRCDATGQWTVRMGQCDVVSCNENLTQPVHGKLNYTGGIEGIGTYNTVVRVICDEGYMLAMTSEVRCNKSGEWEGLPGICTEVHKDAEPESSVAGIAGGVTAALCVVTLGIITVVILYKRRRKGPEDRTVDTTLNEIPSSSDGKTEKGSVNIGKSVNAQPRERKHQNENPESDVSKNVYMNSNDNSKEYYSFMPHKVTDKHSIRIEDIYSFFLSRKNKPNLYDEEYNKLPIGLIKPHEVALLPENRSKNRYKNIYPYDDTRVTLKIWDPSKENDYINACYVNGFKTFHAYIAAQGPTTGILNDFWRMIWQTNCSKIVMLTNLMEEGKHKCEQYWPDEGSVEYGDIVVRLVRCETFSDFTIRTLEMRRKSGQSEGWIKEVHQLNQFHFTAWPDRSVPRFASSLVHFRQKIRATKTRQARDGPMVIHCSAGIGRTGTFLALDYLIDQAEELGYINVVKCLEAIRKQRVNLVQTVEQYIFLHEAIVEALTGSTKALSTSEFQETYNTLLERDHKTGKRKMDHEFEKLPMYVSDPGEDVYENAKNIENRHKNRYSNILPDKNHCPFLNVYVKGRDSYINAVFLPAYKENDIFIITQMPLENTVVDFWRMVYQFEVGSIVMLNNLSEMKEEERYWTEDDNTLEIGPFKITLESKVCDDLWTNYIMLLNYNNERRRVRLSRATYWPDGKPIPMSPSAMLKQIELIQNWQQETGNKPIIVHCMNGADRSGLFCVIAALLERTKIEHDVAVEHIVKQMRSRRPQIIPNVDQFKFCYDAVLAYLDTFDTYSNFTGL